jgi:hypothetical protein
VDLAEEHLRAGISLAEKLRGVRRWPGVVRRSPGCSTRVEAAAAEDLAEEIGMTVVAHRAAGLAHD